jgi:hypothetical protein
VVRIIGDCGPARENTVVLVTYKQSSLSAKVELLKAEILSVTVYNDDNDDDDNNNNNNNNNVL